MSLLNTIKYYGLLVLSMVFVNVSAQVLKTMKHLPGTGQFKSYTNTFGENADYQFYNPYFIANGKTVLDTVTGLLWQVTDGGEMTFVQAKTYCDTLTLGGYTDWRLPNPHEAFSILNHDVTNPAIDVNYFTKTAAEYWWSGTQQVGDPSKVWCTNAGGGIGNHPISETISAGGAKKFHVRAVRDVQAPKTIQTQWVQTNQMVYDSLTQFYWTPFLSSDTLTWEQALTYAEQLIHAGYSDWRLPNIKELQSINDESRSNPSVSTVVFPQVGVKSIWSSSSLPNQTTKAWYLDTKFGITTYKTKTNRTWVLCVRGGTPPVSAIQSSAILHKVNLYPNPSHGYVKVHMDHPMQLLSVYDQMGRLLFQFQPNANVFELPILSKGLYTLRIHTEGFQTTECLIIE